MSKPITVTLTDPPCAHGFTHTPGVSAGTTVPFALAEAAFSPFARVQPYVDEDLSKIPLEAIPTPERFNLIVKPVGIKKKVGSIILADQTIDAQEWTHGTALVCKVGPSVFRGQRFKDMNLHPDDAPKVGDLVYIMPRNPNRFEVDGELYMLIADDGIYARLDPQHAHRIKYKF